MTIPLIRILFSTNVFVLRIIGGGRELAKDFRCFFILSIAKTIK